MFFKSEKISDVNYLIQFPRCALVSYGVATHRRNTDENVPFSPRFRAFSVGKTAVSSVFRRFSVHCVATPFPGIGSIAAHPNAAPTIAGHLLPPSANAARPIAGQDNCRPADFKNIIIFSM